MLFSGRICSSLCTAPQPLADRPGNSWWDSSGTAMLTGSFSFVPLMAPAKEAYTDICSIRRMIPFSVIFFPLNSTSSYAWHDIQDLWVRSFTAAVIQPTTLQYNFLAKIQWCKLYSETLHDLLPLRAGSKQLHSSLSPQLDDSLFFSFPSQIWLIALNIFRFCFRFVTSV